MAEDGGMDRTDEGSSLNEHEPPPRKRSIEFVTTDPQEPHGDDVDDVGGKDVIAEENSLESSDSDEEEEAAFGQQPKAGVMRHKQRNRFAAKSVGTKGAGGDDSGASSVTTRHTVFKSKDAARSNRVKVGRRKSGSCRPISSSADGSELGSGRFGGMKRGMTQVLNRKEFYKRELDYKDLKRNPAEIDAMSNFERVRRRMTTNLALVPAEEHDDSSLNRQYKIPPPKDDGATLLYGLSAFLKMKFIDLIFWKFKTSFLNVIVVFLLLYLIFCNLFTMIIYGVVTRTSNKEGGVGCIDGWDYVGDSGGARLNWELAFALSWTSFSTVGFGTISPGVDVGCYGIRYTCAIEAFLGVLYAGFCGAIFFAKFSRLMGRAQVVFSSTICIQYGEGAGGVQQGGSMIWSTSSSSKKKKVPYPVFEFRIVNTRANERGCEILDATIACLACVNEGSLNNTERPIPAKQTSVMRGSITSSEQSTPMKQQSMFYGSSGRGKTQQREESTDSAGELGAPGTPCKIVFEDTSDANEQKLNLMRQKYHNLELSSRHHPYFRRIWYLRHQLDANSPLVQPEVRSEIKKCGHWPSELNDHISVRESLVPFNDIIVTLNGTSNLNASDVFAQYKYKFRDVHVGWQFAGMMYVGRRIRGKEKRMKVDTSLIHDILPQNGGGNEPIGVTE